MLQNRPECGKLTVRDGYLICPVCKAKKIQRILPSSEGRSIPVYCRRCKMQMLIDIDQGQCTRCQS